MATPKISLLEEKPMKAFKCEMCTETTKKNKFSWISWFTGQEITICRDCAYKESFGSKNVNKNKKQRILEKK